MPVADVSITLYLAVLLILLQRSNFDPQCIGEARADKIPDRGDENPRFVVNQTARSGSASDDDDDDGDDGGDDDDHDRESPDTGGWGFWKRIQVTFKLCQNIDSGKSQS